MTSISNISTQIPPALTTQAAVTPVTQLAGGQKAAGLSQISPSRLLSDPLSGVVITQYFDNTGQVVSQVPTQTVVAYLQIGLTADGFSKQSTQSTTA